MKNLDTDVIREKIDSGIKTTMRRANEIPFPYNNQSTLGEIGMDNIAAADFLMDLEDEYDIRFNLLIAPLQEAALEKARAEQAKAKESSWYEPDIENQDKYLRIGQIVEYIQEHTHQPVA